MERLRDLLIKARLVTEAQVREAEKMGLEHNATLAHVLVRGGVIDTQKLAIFLSKKLRLEYAALAERTLSANVLEQIPLAVAQRLRVIPIALRKTREGDEVVIAMSDPTDGSARREVEHVVKKRVLALVADEVALQRAINQWYGRAPAAATPNPAAAAPSFFNGPAASSPPAAPAVPPGPPAVQRTQPHNTFPPLAAPNPAAQFGNQVAPQPSDAHTAPVVSGVPLHGITLDGEDDELELELDYGRSGVTASPASSQRFPPPSPAPTPSPNVAPADFLSESTVDVAQMYEKAKEAKASPLDAITLAPQPPVDLDSDPGIPHLQHSRAKPKDPRDMMGDAAGFLTPNTEEHAAMLGRPGGDFADEISLDEDTAWLRQRMRGEAAKSQSDVPPKKPDQPTAEATKRPDLKGDAASTPPPKPRRKEQGNKASSPLVTAGEKATAVDVPAFDVPNQPSPPPRKRALAGEETGAKTTQSTGAPPPANPPRSGALAARPDRAPTTPKDFLADASTPSATTPTPPRVHSAATTREVGAPKAATRPRRKDPPPIAASGPMSETENPTAAFVLDEPTRMDVEGKIGAGGLFDLPSLPSDENVEGAFDGPTVQVEALPPSMPPPMATDVSLAPPSLARGTLPSDSRAVAPSSRPLVKIDDSQTELTVTPLERESPERERPGDNTDPVAMPPQARPSRRRRRPSGDDGPTKIIDFDAKKLDEHRKKKESEGERRANELKRLREDARTKRSDVESPRPAGDVEAEIQRMRDRAQTKVVNVSEDAASESGHFDEPKRDAASPLVPSAQPTVVVDIDPGDDDAPTRVGEPPPRRRRRRHGRDQHDDELDAKSDDATRVTSTPKPREEKTLASIPTMDDPQTQIDDSMGQMTMCIVCSQPRLRVALGRTLRKTVSMLYLEESLTAARRLSARIDVDIVVLINPDADANLSDEIDRLNHRAADRPLILLLSPVGVRLKVRRAHVRLELPDEDEMIPDSIAETVRQMLDV